MNDFLGQLASRALAPEKALKPRLLTAFEPASPAPGPLLAALDPGATPEPQPAAAMEGIPQSQAVRPVPNSVSEGSADSAPDQRLRPVTGERPQPMSAHGAAVPAALPEAGARPLSPAAPVPGQRLEEAASFRPRRALGPPAGTDQDAARAPSAAIPPRATHPERNSELPPARKGSPLQQQENGRPEKRGQPTLPALNSLLAGLRPRLTPPPSRPEPLLRAEAPSTIHVTIGRIEVRAAAPPAPTPPARRPRPAPALGLQEYLERRKGGPTR